MRNKLLYSPDFLLFLRIKAAHYEKALYYCIPNDGLLPPLFHYFYGPMDGSAIPERRFHSQ